MRHRGHIRPRDNIHHIEHKEISNGMAFWEKKFTQRNPNQQWQCQKLDWVGQGMQTIRSITDHFVLSATDSFYRRRFRTFDDHFVLSATVSYFWRLLRTFTDHFVLLATMPLRTIADQSSYLCRPAFVPLPTNLRTFADQHPQMIQHYQQVEGAFHARNLSN